MAAVAIDVSDLFLPVLSPAEQTRAETLIATVIARAARVAPCILTDPSVAVAAKGILVDVVTRRFDRSVQPGVNVTKAMGNRSISVDGSGVPVVPFYPAEIAELQELCTAAAGDVGGEYAAPMGSFPDPRPWPDGLCDVPLWPSVGRGEAGPY